MLFEQISTTVIDDESLPWVPFTPHADGVFVKYFKLDPIRGEMILLMKMKAGAELPRHRHSGSLVVYTIKGRWKCKEQDWIAGPGSVVFETAATSHTPKSLPSAGEVLALHIVAGDQVFLDDEGQVVATENWRTAMERYLAYCEAALVTPRDLTAFS